MKKQGILVASALLMVTQLAFGQGKYGATPEDSTNCLRNTSLYTEFYRQKNYQDARSPWLKAVELCPKSSENLYIKGIGMYRSFAKAAKKSKDTDLTNTLVDTIAWIYDQRIEHFGKRGYNLGRKGVDVSRFGGKARAQDAYDALAESFTLQGDKMEAAPLATYYQVTYKLYAQKKLEINVLIELFSPLSEVAKKNMTQEGKKGEAYKSAYEQMEKIFIAVASCPELIKTFQPQFDANPSDTTLLKDIITYLEKRDCTEEELFLKASMELDKVQPSAKSKLGIGIGLLKKERYSDAVEYLKQAGEMATDDETKETAYYYAARGYFAVKSYAAVKTYALKTLGVNPNNGGAYMLIGDAYFYGSSTVGDDACTKKGGVWASMGKYAKAKQVDPSLAEKANQKIATARTQFPKKEDCFFLGLNEGDSHTVEGWINETVTVQTL